MTRTLALSALLAAAAALPAQEVERPGDNRVVRAYFDDPLVAAKAVMSLDALESEYEKGYIVLRATEEDIETARRAGMRIVETDDYDSVVLPSEPPTEAMPGTIAGFPCYRTVEKTYASARAIADRHPTLAKWSPVGRSWKMVQNAAEGYDLMVLRLTNEATTGPKPILLITTAIHAREYTTAELGLRFAEYLVDSYETDADARWLLDHQEVHLVLQANPDGRKRAEEGVLWRKNHNTNYCPAGLPGVDLNRNFAFGWHDPGGSSDDHCSQIFRGPGPASEPETRAVANYMWRLFPDVRGPADTNAAPSGTSGVYLDIHSHGRLVLWPWGHKYRAAPNATALQTFGRKLAFFNDYLPIQGIGFYPATGTTIDHAYGELGVASLLYELGTTFFQDCDDFERSILDPNLESLLYAFKVARTPYLTPAGPDVRDLSLSGRASTAGVAAGSPVRLSAILDDTRYQDGNGAEPTQTIAAGEYTIDVPPWNAGALAHRVSAADGSFDSGAEQATAVIDTSGLETGRHSVFVRARDADGNWGAVSAVFLFVQADDGSTDDTDDDDDDPGSGESGGCVVDENTACLHDARYRVRVTWLSGNGRTGAATTASSATDDSGLFWFFDPDNWEVLIKVLDGCALNNHIWVYGASTTDLGYTVRVTDTATGLEREYRNEPGVPASAITDATAFPDGCRPP
ncbi:MAG: M14 family zinc carboxypeptidase [Acidobacteriota bacterium]|nr:M14 family zinc carboxypeptidase [Acidobacteriota bacterium]